MVTRDDIEKLAINMHVMKTHMQNLHIASQQCNAGTWTAESEAEYQLSRAGNTIRQKILWTLQ